MEQEAIVQLFKVNKIKNTKQRQRVFEYLTTCNQPVTADAIYMELSRDIQFNESVNLSTIYRILDLFIKSQLVTKNTFGNDHKATFEIAKREHGHHLICIKCNQITAINGCPLKGYEKSLSQTTHFQILNHKLEIFGVCPKCQGPC